MGNSIRVGVVLALVVVVIVVVILIVNNAMKGLNDPYASPTPPGDSTPPDTSGIVNVTPPAGTDSTPTYDVTIPIQDLTLSKGSFTLMPIGAEYQLTVTKTPANSTADVIWSSEDESIAIVDARDGRVTAVSEGNTRIICTAEGNIVKTAMVYVRDSSDTGAPVDPVNPNANASPSPGGNTNSSLKLSTNDVTLKVSGSGMDKAFTLKVRSGSDTAYGTDATYYSDNPAVADVDSDGKVTAISRGTATIHVTKDGQTATCIIRVGA
jgi:alpha-amylase